ncbi:MAG: SDR family oxidoreductase [bacterium]|nr:SDR family oxidoreductase [bacterium]
MVLAERHALVTGGGSGIGRAVALRLAALGAAVSVVDRDAASATATAEAITAAGGRAASTTADVADGTAVAAAVAAARAAHGPLLVLVNSAGIAGFAPLVDLDEATWDRMIGVHLRGTYLCARAVLPDMLAAGYGRIVNLSSVAGVRGGPQLCHYAAAKAGIIGFTKALAQEVGPRGITANAVAPGPIDTPMLRGSGIPDAVLEQSVRNMPVGRLGTADDVAAAVAWLVSPDAGFVTGQVLSPNGGGYM